MNLSVDLPAGTIHYRVYDADDGQGETLVFVHGFAVDGRLWEPVALRLAAAGLHCIVPTWPFGSHTTPMKADADVSPPGAARIIADFLAALDLEDVTIVANDSGGAVSQLLVTSDPSRISRLVLTNCDSFDNFPPGPFKRLSRLARVPGVGLLVAQGLRFEPILRGSTAFGAVNAQRQPTDLLRSFVAPLIRDRRIRRDAMRFFGAADTADTLAAAAKLPDLEIPALLVWGEDDTLFPVSDAKRLAGALPDCELVLVRGAKTFSPLDQPAAVADAIAAFVAARPIGSRR